MDRFKRKTQTLIYNLIVGFYIKNAFAAYPNKPSIEQVPKDQAFYNIAKEFFFTKQPPKPLQKTS